MKKALVFLFLTFSFLGNTQHQLTDSAEVSILTVGPGASLNDAFGHSAFRIKDQTKGLDIVYGYGEYDFDSPNFYLKFAQGKLNYLISKTSFKRFIYIYTYFDRTVKQQTLDLTLEQKQKLYDYLIDNYKPEKRAYLYDFFFDNCATKIRDVAQIALDNNIVFNTPNDYEQKTFRSLIYENVDKNSWGSFGIDIALGSVIDTKASSEEHMFLPEKISTFFNHATIQNKPLVKETKIVYKKQKEHPKSNLLSSPLFTFGIIGLVIILITFNDYKKSKQSKWLDVTLFAFTGIAGIIMLLLWFATNHQSTHHNYNLLWAFALNALTIFQLFKKDIAKWFVSYLKLLVILLCLLVFHWISGVQVFAISLIPFLIGLLVRYLYLIKYYR